MNPYSDISYWIQIWHADVVDSNIHHLVDEYWFYM